MKKSTEELILSEVIKINTEVVKIHSELGYIKQDIKNIYTVLQEHEERFDRLEIKTDKGFLGIHSHIERFDYMFDEAGRLWQDHKKRIVVLETNT